MKVIALDIDGVLNSASFLRGPAFTEEMSFNPDAAFDPVHQIDPVRVERLNDVIARTGAKIVLSSSWRVVVGVERTMECLRERGLVGELVGVTPRLGGASRADEIRTWLGAHPEVTSHVVLDDNVFADLEDGRYVFVRDGLEAEHVELAVAILGGRLR